MTGWLSPKVCHGQIVEVSYLCAGDMILERSHDRSTDRTTYAVAEIAATDWSWYETYQPGGLDAPPIPGDRWRPIAADRVQAIEREWVDRG